MTRDPSPAKARGLSLEMNMSETKVRPLTPMQLEALQAVAQGLVIERNCGSAAFRISGANPSVVGRLRSLGLIRWTKSIGGDAELTDAGWVALAKATGASA